MHPTFGWCSRTIGGSSRRSGLGCLSVMPKIQPSSHSMCSRSSHVSSGSPSNALPSAPSSSSVAKCSAMPRIWEASLMRGVNSCSKSEGYISANTIEYSSVLFRPVSKGHILPYPSRRLSACNAYKTGRPVSVWPPTEPTPFNFQTGCALGARISHSLFSGRSSE